VSRLSLYGRRNAMSETNPYDPPPQEDPTHDVPVYPEEDPPPGTESVFWIVAGPGEHDAPDEGDDDVDEDDLDPQAPHSPPDADKGRVVFDENKVAG
jgi:hypothetical protein